MPYDRPPLSKEYLAGTWDDARIQLRGAEELDAEWMLGSSAGGLDMDRRRVLLSGGDSVGFDGLVIATGCRPRHLPGTPGFDGIFTLRTVDDSRRLRGALLEGSPRVVVVGAGFIGSEVASTCRGLGLEVTVLETLPIPLERIVGPEMGSACAALHLDNGTQLRLGAGVAGFEGRDRIEAVRLSSGEMVDADVVVVGVGVVPNTEWLEGSGLTIDNGIVVDDHCFAAPGVVAAGDVARQRGRRFEHWTNAVEQGQAAATALLRGDEASPFESVPYFWSDQYGTKIQLVGDVQPGDEVVQQDGVATYTRGGELVGALGFNRPGQLMRYRAQLRPAQ
jgi:3-phenylpropionate/trans-cinnamate dioxygenase ferredoxin reductase component